MALLLTMTRYALMGYGEWAYRRLPPKTRRI